MLHFWTNLFNKMSFDTILFDNQKIRADHHYTAYPVAPRYSLSKLSISKKSSKDFSKKFRKFGPRFFELLNFDNAVFFAVKSICDMHAF